MDIPDIEHRILVIPPTAADGLAMSKVFQASEVAGVVCSGTSQLLRELPIGAGALVISEEAVLADSRALLSYIAAQPVWSDIPVILLTRAGRQTATLDEIAALLGNVSLIERPIRAATLVSLVKSALRARARQYQVREYLSEKLSRELEREQLLESERAARAEAEKASRIKDEFLATLSHELRTPLNAILGWTQVLRRTQQLPGEAASALSVIERNARAQAQIIADLLEMSSIINGKVRLDVQQIDAAAIVRNTIETVRPAAEAKSINLEIAVDATAGAIRGDPNRLQQVFWNLLTNAVKFTPNGGRIAVSLARADSHLEVAVRDDGEGIDPAFLPQVFDRFRQSDASTTRRHGGLGLGLSIAKQLVEMHGGTIKARSAGLGQGATFSVSLPLEVGVAHLRGSFSSHEHLSPATDLPQPQSMTETDLAGLKVLVVDDEPDARSLVQKLLVDRNAVVATAGSASEAMDKLLHEAPDVLVSDIGMPGEDGYSLIRRIRALPNASAKVPAIALTAYARVEDRAKAERAGYQVHLAKPVEPFELVSMVQQLTRRPAAAD